MGNCMAPSSRLVSAETSGEFARTTKVNGRVLQYKAPVPIQEGQHTIPQQVDPNESLDSHHLHPEYSAAQNIKKRENRGKRRGQTKDLSSSKPAVSCVNSGEGVVRVKLVIRKQELAELLSNGLGKGTTLEDLLVELQGKGQAASVDNLWEKIAAQRGWAATVDGGRRWRAFQNVILIQSRNLRALIL